ncbi:MAG: hypothetical protein DRJ03_24940 [Chloroflexi bacterium]|nr:MAG: hypothetical protein DRJ03_24940 [Chloroflexota bacterium]
MEQIEDVHLVLSHLTCTVIRKRMQRIEPPVSLMLDTSGWQRERQPVALPCSLVVREGEGCR